MYKYNVFNKYNVTMYSIPGSINDIISHLFVSFKPNRLFSYNNLNLLKECL